MVVAVENDLHKLYEYADEEQEYIIPCKKVPHGDIYEAARAGDLDRLAILLESGVNVNARDPWDSVALYYTCLAGHEQAARMLLENGAICSEHTFDGDRCHYAALNLRLRRLLKAFEARPPPLAPLPDSLRNLFFRSGYNSRYMDPTLGESNTSGDMIEPDIVFYVHGESISAHRAILLARCPFFRKKFSTEWKSRREVRLVKERLSSSALFSLISFFYSDKLDVAVDDLEDLIRICKVCGCSGLREILEAEVVHQKYADYKALQDADDSIKRFIFLGSSLPPEERLSYSMLQLLRISLARSSEEYSTEQGVEEEDHADIYFLVEGRRFRCHRAILAARSDYIRARILRMNEFIQSEDIDSSGLPLLEEHDMSSETFERLLHYIYTDVLGDIDLDQVEEMLDVASRYLLFPLKRVVADAVFPHLDNMSSAEICRWLLISDMYGVGRIKEYCLDSMAVNFETFANTPEFKSMLRTLPPPSGDSSTRTTAPSAPGGNKTDQGNLLDDLRERWLEAEGQELNKRDESAKEFDNVLKFLIESSIDDENTQD